MSVKFRAAAAMEYLIVHGWAFLLIALVFLALFQLGAFNFFTSPRAPPGSCTVVRPNGPGTNQFLSLGGLCTGQIPEFVMEFSGVGTNWNLQCAHTGSCVAFYTPYGINGTATCNATLVAWSYDSGMGANGIIPSAEFNNWWDAAGYGLPAEPGNAVLGGVIGVFNGAISKDGIEVEYNDTVIRFSAQGYPGEPQKNQWIMKGNFFGRWVLTGIVVTKGNAVGYINGTAVTPPSPTQTCMILGNGTIGTWDRNFNGYIADIQLYSVALSANDMHTLYAEGIGGVPIDLPGLAGWYPLNGNLNNYAGNLGSTVAVDNIVDFSPSFPTPPPS